MAGILTFKLAPLKALAEHAIRAKQRLKDPNDFYVPQTGPKAKVKPALMLVYGQGIYLQSNGLPVLPTGSDRVYSTQTNSNAGLVADWKSVAARIMDEPDEFLFHMEELIPVVLKGIHAGHSKLVVEVNVLGIADFHTSSRRFPNMRQIARHQRKRLSRRKVKPGLFPY